jgi:hypothetical protein
MTEKAKLTIDYDRVWAALSRSTQVRDRLAEIAEKVRDEATSLARSEAYDTGKYAAGIETGTLPARQVREKLRANRFRGSGKRFSNPLIAAEFRGDPSGGSYDGTVGIVASRDWKSFLIEFGSIARSPSLVLTRAAQNVASRVKGVQWVALFEGKTTEQNLTAWRETGGPRAIAIATKKRGQGRSRA